MSDLSVMDVVLEVAMPARMKDAIREVALKIRDEQNNGIGRANMSAYVITEVARALDRDLPGWRTREVDDDAH